MAMQYGRPTMNTPRARALGLSDGRKANEERAAAEAQSALEAAEQQLKIESQRQDAAVKRQRAEAQAAGMRELLRLRCVQAYINRFGASGRGGRKSGGK
jgi:hypothetical protein